MLDGAFAKAIQKRRAKKESSNPLSTAIGDQLNQNIQNAQQQDINDKVGKGLLGIVQDNKDEG